MISVALAIVLSLADIFLSLVNALAGSAIVATWLLVFAIGLLWNMTLGGDVEEKEMSVSLEDFYE